jgi:hypothetical protein
MVISNTTSTWILLMELPENLVRMSGSLCLPTHCIRHQLQKEENVQLNAQREEKLKKKELIRQKKKLIVCQKEYGDKFLTYIDIANSPAFWISKAMANKEYKKATKLHRQAQCSEVADLNSCHWFQWETSKPSLVERRSSIHR